MLKAVKKQCKKSIWHSKGKIDEVPCAAVRWACSAAQIEKQKSALTAALDMVA